MRVTRTLGLFVIFALPFWSASSFAQETDDAGFELRPKLTVAIELFSRTRVETWIERQHGTNFSFNRCRSGALLTHRMKPILKTHRRDIDDNQEHHLVFGAGYEYLHTVQNGKTKIENRILAQMTPHALVMGLLLADRNRGEFRWVNGAYDFRYRNKLVISGRLQAGAFRYTPYVSGELYYDRNHAAWNQSQYGFGTEFPYRKRLMLDTYFLHQNCTSCDKNPVNMLGATLNLYVR